MTQIVNMLTDIACSRFIKESMALLYTGSIIRPLVCQIGGADFPFLLPNWSFWNKRQGLNGLAGPLHGETGEHIWHIHAEPAGLAAAARKLNSHIPIVLDVHDASWGWGEAGSPAELEDVQAADAILVPSMAYKRRCPRKNGVFLIRSGCLNTRPQSNLILRNGGLVYEGGLNAAWRDHREQFGQLVQAGAMVKAFSPNEGKVKEVYQEVGVEVEHVEYGELFKRLESFNFGLALAPNDTDVRYKASWPNKYADYLEAGLPVLTWGIPEVAEHVRKFKCGKAYDRFSDLVEDVRRKKLNPREYEVGVKVAAEDLHMFAQVPKIHEAYEYAMNMRRNFS